MIVALFIHRISSHSSLYFSNFNPVEKMEKALDSVDRNFIIAALEAYGFGPNFVYG